MKPSVCVVIPAYNEVLAIAATIVSYRAALPYARIIVVDNNSTDGTSTEALTVLRDTDLVLYEARPGKGAAVKKALSRVQADVYIMTDADDTYPAADAARLLERLLETRADMVVGDRVSEGAYAAQNSRHGHSVGNRVITTLVSFLAGQKYLDVLSGLRVMSRPFVDVLDLRSPGFQLETELNIIATNIRADVIEVPIDYRARPEGSVSKLKTYRDGVRILWFAFINWIALFPMHAFGIVSALSFIVALLLGLQVFDVFIRTGAMPYASTAVAAAGAAIVGVQAAFTGLTLRILGREERRRDVAAFLVAKRAWNAALDAHA